MYSTLGKTTMDFIRIQAENSNHKEYKEIREWIITMIIT